MTQPSVIHSRISGRNIKPFEMGELTSAAVRDLSRIGIHIDPRIVRDQIACMDAAGAFTGDTATMDANFIAPITAPSIPTLIQFLQFWLPGFVHVLTTARRIDEIIGITTAGAWEDEEIVQGIVEPAGLATEYGDYTSVPLTNWNPNFEARTIVRGEQGISVGILEEARAARMRLNSSDIKRRQAGINLEIFRNAVGFFGWNSGTGRTFGLLNDPNLPAPITSSVEGGWAKASSSSDAFQKITGDIRMWIATLRTQSGGNIDPKAENIVLALPTNRVDYLSVTTDFGISVRGWIEDTYPKIRIIDAPEFQGTKTTATGGGNEGTPVIAEDNMAYLFVEEFDKAIDGSTDDGSVFSQLVQSKFLTLGVEKRVKTYVEDYSAATAGVLCKRPVGVVRILGI